MKITGIKVQLIQYERPYYRWCDGLPALTTRPVSPFLRILTDEGIEGHCFTAGDLLDAGVEAVGRMIVGEDPMNRERIWQRMWRANRFLGFQGRFGSVDIALWDLAGKTAGQPVYKLLGGYRDEIPAYASTTTLESVEEYEDLARSCVERGYTAIKLHIWGEPRRDLALCQAIRKAVGDDIILMLDASSLYTVEESLWFGRSLEELNYYWFEEPIDHFNLSGLADLTKRLTIPLAVAESTSGSVVDAATHIKMGAGSIVITDPTFKAGFTGSIKTAHLWEAYGLNCAVHGWDIACLHTVCAIPSCRYFESLIPEGINQTKGISTAITEVDSKGMVRPWQKPGLGMELDWDFLNAHTINTLEFVG